MLERIAVHQTRLRVPGLGLDARGIALGARGLVLLPSIDRLIAFLAVYTQEQTLSGLGDALKIEVLKSKLGTREIALSFDAGSSDRMDRVAEVSRLAGGFTFTGTSRHFVQYRDAAAPFGYDSTEISATDAALALYHSTFAQSYDVERPLDLRGLLLSLSPHLDPGAVPSTRDLWVVAEAGLGPSLLGYFTRSGANARTGIAEWPPESSFDDQPVRRFLFQVRDLPPRMMPLLTRTPGVSTFATVAPGVGVEVGFRHPIALEACPGFSAEGLVLFRGRGERALSLEKVPALADVRSLASANVSAMGAHLGKSAKNVANVGVELRLAPDFAPPTTVAAILVPTDELPLLRRLSYVLGAQVIQSTRMALTDFGAFLLREQGLDALPVGTFFRRIHPNVYVPAGWRVVPDVPDEVVFQALGSPSDQLVFFWPNGSAGGLPSSQLVPLETALLEGHTWAPIKVHEIENPFAEQVPTVWLEPLGINPLKGTGAS
jgi:hypothetical protein